MSRVRSTTVVWVDGVPTATLGNRTTDGPRISSGRSGRKQARRRAKQARRANRRRA